MAGRGRKPPVAGQFPRAITDTSRALAANSGSGAVRRLFDTVAACAHLTRGQAGRESALSRPAIRTKTTARTKAMRSAAIAAALFSLAALVPLAPAQARGCLKGAVVGGAAGHFAGHHGWLGAAAGCAIGHHEASKRQPPNQNHY